MHAAADFSLFGHRERCAIPERFEHRLKRFALWEVQEVAVPARQGDAQVGGGISIA